MRNLKRALSLALASVMLVGMMVVGAGAASFPDVDASDNTEAIDVLNAVEVMIGDGDTGNFRPEDNVSRNEMAVILAKLILGKDADKYVGTCPFTDVPEWAQKYVAACYDNQIVAGRGEGIYDGSATVTAQEAAAMVLRVLGYEKLEGTGANWAQSVVAKANEISLFKDVAAAANTPLKRNQVAQLGLNALQATMVVSDVEQDIILEGVATIPGKATYTDRTSNESWATSIDDTRNSDNKQLLQLGEYLYEGKLEKLTDNQFDIAGRPGTKWEYNGDEVGTYGTEANRVYVVKDGGKTVSDILTSKDYFNYASGRFEIGASKKTALYLNGEEKTDATTLLAKGDVVEVYLYDEPSADGAAVTYARNDVESVVVLRYVAAKVDEVDTDVSSSLADDGVSAILTLKSFNDNIEEFSGGDYYDYVNSDAADKVLDKRLRGYNADYTEDTVLAVAADSSGKIIDSYPAKVVTGQPGSVRDVQKENTLVKNGYIKIDGTQFNYAGTIEGVPNYDYEAEYNVYMTNEDFVLGVEGAEGVTLNDVYYVTGVYRTSGTYGKSTWYAQAVLLSDGTVEDIKIDSDFVTSGLEAMLKADAGDSKLYETTNAEPVNGVKSGEAFNAADTNKLYTTVNKLFTFDKDGEPEVWDGDSDYTVNATSLASDFKTDDSRISTGAGRYYVSDSTRFVSVEDVGDDIDVKVATGGMSAKIDPALKQVIVIRSGSNASYVVYIGEVKGAAEDVVYVADQPNSTSGKDKWNATLYFMEDNREEDVIVDDDYLAGFYTYSINSDDVYELSAVSSEVLTGSDVSGGIFDDDAKGCITDAKLLSRSGSMADGKFGSTSFSGAEFGSALIMDDDDGAHEDIYNGEINSVSRLRSAIDAAAEVVADIYVTDGDITFVYVKSLSNALTDVDDSDIASGAIFDEDGKATIEGVASGSTPNVPADKTLTINGDVEGSKISTTGTGAVVLEDATVKSDTLDLTDADVTLKNVTVAEGKVVTVADAKLEGTLTLDGANAKLVVNTDVTPTGESDTIKGTEGAQIQVDENATATNLVEIADFYIDGVKVTDAADLKGKTFTWDNDGTINAAARAARTATAAGWFYVSEGGNEGGGNEGEGGGNEGGDDTQTQTTISAVEFGSFTAPAKGVALANPASVTTTGVTATYAWAKSDKTAVNAGDNAEADTAYVLTATLSLTDETKYKFGDTVTATLGGKSGEWNSTAKTLTFTFDKTAADDTPPAAETYSLNTPAAVTGTGESMGSYSATVSASTDIAANTEITVTITATTNPKAGTDTVNLSATADIGSTTAVEFTKDTTGTKTIKFNMPAADVDDLALTVTNVVEGTVATVTFDVSSITGTPASGDNLKITLGSTEYEWTYDASSATDVATALTALLNKVTGDWSASIESNTITVTAANAGATGLSTMTLTGKIAGNSITSVTGTLEDGTDEVTTTYPKA